MKKFINLFFIIALVMIGFTSCEKKEDVSAGIPGMGETPGELEIKDAFVDTDGTIDGITFDIQGAEQITSDDLLSSGQNQLKSTSGLWNYYGCGGSWHNSSFKFWIRIKLTLTNSSDYNKCVIFPAGLVFKVNEPGYQNGILLQSVKVCINPKITKEIYLFAFCLNKGRDGSNANVTYTMPGITGSNWLWNYMLYRLERKRINIENFLNTSPSAQLKSANAEDLAKFEEIADHLQNALWTITNDGEELSQEQIDYIDAIPEIEE